MEGHDVVPPSSAEPGDVDRAAAWTSRRRRTTRSRPRLATTCCSTWPTATTSLRPATCRAAQGGARPVRPGDRRRPRRVHPLRPLRPRLRRHPGQRRDRPQRQGLLHADRLRPRRPDGRSSCVTCGECVPPARPARSPTSRSTTCPSVLDRARRRRQRLPLLRGRVRADLLRRPRARRHRFRRGPGPAGVAGPALRQGPLRLGLRGFASGDRAADPGRRVLPQGPAVGGRTRRGHRPTGRAGGRRKPGGLVPYDEVLPHFREATWAEAIDLVGSTGFFGSWPSTAGWARGVRLGKVLQRGGLPVPEVLRTAFRTTTWTTAPGCATPPASRPCSRASGRVPSPRRTATSRTPTSSSSPAATPPPWTSVTGRRASRGPP